MSGFKISDAGMKRIAKSVKGSSLKKYKIESEAGVDMGTFAGENEEEALDNMAVDAGYANAAEAEAVTGQPFEGYITEVTDEGEGWREPRLRTY